MKQSEYQKYRWFFTSTDKLVVGGKSADQNDSLLRKLKKQKHDYTIMHTALPGSPFSVILSTKKPSLSDLKETAIFTACFSRLWRLQKKKAEIHIFNLSQLHKSKSMKIGTWQVLPPIKKIKALLELVLIKQKTKLRAVPPQTTKSPLLKIIPGNTDKTILTPKLQVLLPSNISKDELLSALPPGGLSVK